MQILLVEDEVKTADVVCRGLELEGYQVSHAVDAETALKFLTENEYDVMVTDVMMPGIDGFELVQKLRARDNSIPVLILSARGGLDDRVKGLEIGGDDYLVKPFEHEELIARLNSLVRRARAGSQPTTIEVNSLKIDIVKRNAWRDGEELSLSPMEFDLLTYLAKNAGKVVSKAMLIENVWGYHFDPGTNVVEARMCRLRDKIDKGAGTRLIHTVRGFGYVMESR